MASSPQVLLISLCHFRWAIPLIAEMHRTDGSKFVTLAHCLSISRDSLKRTLAGLVERGWVMKNPGYGHPLRPEYVLSATGRRLGPVCQELNQLLASLGHAGIGLQKWSLPVLCVLAQGALRFSEIKNALADATPRAVTLALKELGEAGLVERAVVDRYPPTAVYCLRGDGTPLASAAAAIGRA